VISRVLSRISRVSIDQRTASATSHTMPQTPVGRDEPASESR
jgi:hypothetical protein